MAKQWLVSFHGGSKTTEHNNIHGFSDQGAPSNPDKVLDMTGAGQVKLDELRGFGFYNGNLWVVNAHKSSSGILKFSGTAGSNGQYAFQQVFTAYDQSTNPGLLHPFNLAFAPDGNLYVSNQDTSCITRYYGPTTRLPGEPIPCQNCPFPGTFIPPQSSTAPNGLQTPRDLLFDLNGNLWVADESLGLLNYSRPNGAFIGIFAGSDKWKPIHLLLDGTNLYVGCGSDNSVQLIDLNAGTSKHFLTPGASGLDGPAGMGLTTDHFYIANRKKQQVLRFRRSNHAPDSKPFISNMGDDPEFLQHLT